MPKLKKKKEIRLLFLMYHWSPSSFRKRVYEYEVGQAENVSKHQKQPSVKECKKCGHKKCNKIKRL